MIQPNPATRFPDDSHIEVLAYSFSAYNQPAGSFTAHKVFLDILLQHPRSSETITLRTIAPIRLLCSSKAEVEAAVYREIRSALSFQSMGFAS